MGKYDSLIDTLYKTLPLDDIYKNPLFIVDIFIVIVIFYIIYRVFKNTRAERIFYGFIILGVMFFLSSFFNLYLVNLLLGITFFALIVAMPVVFQPELRSALEKLGRTGINKIGSRKNETNKTLKTIISSVAFMSKNKIGSIIAIQGKTGLNDHTTSGVIINGNVSKDLLVSCFITESPLHDGAVLIRENKIISASSILPLSESDQVLALGTRHRAGLGLSEISDAQVIIVSEKTGQISFAKLGKFYNNISLDELTKKIKKS
ncbi:TIGR00159 family protein [bacterium]|nr:TIGR00159 family protein [bacterium]